MAPPDGSLGAHWVLDYCYSAIAIAICYDLFHVYINETRLHYCYTIRPEGSLGPLLLALVSEVAVSSGDAFSDMPPGATS